MRLRPSRVCGTPQRQTRGASSVSKEVPIEIDGIVDELLRNSTFRVTLANGHSVLATIAGKMRKFRIRVLAGDRVTLALSPYDLTRGRIVYRHKYAAKPPDASTPPHVPAATVSYP